MDLLSGLKSQPPGKAAEMLKSIHEARRAGHIPAAGLAGPLTPGPLPQLHDLIASGLQDLIRGQQEFAQLVERSLRVSLPAAAPAAPANGYDELRARFDQLEAMMQSQVERVNDLLDRDGQPDEIRAPKGLRQEGVFLQCRLTGRTSGRFRCSNPGPREVRVTAEAGQLKTGSGDVVTGAAVSVRHPEFQLPPGASELVVVDVDLSEAASSALSHLEGTLDVRMDGVLTAKIWIEVDTYDGA